jgi:septal ring factor EnvC (AmiA/AmiB activator)
MTATLTASLLLGGAGLLTAIFGTITQARDRRRNIRKQEGDIEKLEGSIRLDETTRTRLAAEAAQINSDVVIAQQNWWREQFDAVKTELVAEQQVRRRLSKWAGEHQEWDKRAWSLALQSDPKYPPPPTLETD